MHLRAGLARDVNVDTAAVELHLHMVAQGSEAAVAQVAARRAEFYTAWGQRKRQ